MSYMRDVTGVRLDTVAVRQAVTPQRYGAKGDGATDDTAALRSWLTSGATSLVLPAGTYAITGTLTQGLGVSVTFEPGAVIKATATIAGPMWDTPAGTLLTRQALRGATFDCNQLAQNGLYLRYVQHFDLPDLRVLSATQHSVIVGDLAAAGYSYEVMIRNIDIYRPQGQAVPVGYNGLWLNHVTDCEITTGIIVGANIGIRTEAGGHRISHVHVWGYSLPSICFDDNASGNIWVACYADSPSLYGFRLRKWASILYACRGYCNAAVADNTAKGIQIDQASAGHLIDGMTFDSVDGTHRWATDYAGNVTGNTIVNTVENYTTATVASPTTTQFILKGQNGSAFRLTGSKQLVNVNTNDTGNAVQLVNGIPVQGYSDLYATQTMGLNPSTGAVQPGSTTGVGSNIYSGTGAPAIAGAVGDFYLRKDTPGTAGQRIYACTVAGAAGAATWVATAA